jgi:hypothetical protein
VRAAQARAESVADKDMEFVPSKACRGRTSRLPIGVGQWPQYWLCICVSIVERGSPPPTRACHGEARRLGERGDVNGDRRWRCAEECRRRDGRMGFVESPSPRHTGTRSPLEAVCVARRTKAQRHWGRLCSAELSAVASRVGDHMPRESPEGRARRPDRGRFRSRLCPC